MNSNQHWQQQIKQFLSHLSLHRQLSPHTLSNYRRDLNKFADYCDQNTLVDAASVHPADVRQWVALLHRRGLNGASLQRALSALRSFYKYHNRNGGKHNPAMGIQAPKSDKKLPSVLSVDSMQQLLSVAGDDWLSIRDRAILELFYSSGLRLSELVDLNLKDLDLIDALITVTGKGRKTRTLPIGSFASKALKQWLAIRLTPNPAEQAVFLSKQGRRLGQRSIQLRLKKYSQQQVWISMSTRICCATPSPATCSNPVVTYAPCRNCLATPISPRPKSIPIWIFSI